MIYFLRLGIFLLFFVFTDGRSKFEFADFVESSTLPTSVKCQDNEEWYEGNHCKRDNCEVSSNSCEENLSGCFCKEGFQRVNGSCTRCQQLTNEAALSPRPSFSTNPVLDVGKASTSKVCTGKNEEWYEGPMCSDTSCNSWKKSCENNKVNGCFCKDGHHREGTDCEPCSPQILTNSEPINTKYLKRTNNPYYRCSTNEEFYQGTLCNPDKCEDRDTRCRQQLVGCVCKNGFHRMHSLCKSCKSEGKTHDNTRLNIHLIGTVELLDPDYFQPEHTNPCTGNHEEWYEGYKCEDQVCGSNGKKCNQYVKGCVCKNNYYRSGINCFKCETRTDPGDVNIINYLPLPNEETCNPNEQWYEGSLCFPETCDQKNATCDRLLVGCVCKNGFNRVGGNCVKCQQGQDSNVKPTPGPSNSDSNPKDNPNTDIPKKDIFRKDIRRKENRKEGPVRRVCSGSNEEWYEGKMCSDKLCGVVKKLCLNFEKGCFCKDGYHRVGLDCVSCSPQCSENEEWFEGGLCNVDSCGKRDTSCDNFLTGCICKEGYHRVSGDCVNCNGECDDPVPHGRCYGQNEEWYKGGMCGDEICGVHKKSCPYLVQGCFCKDGYQRVGSECTRCPQQYGAISLNSRYNDNNNNYYNNDDRCTSNNEEWYEGNICNYNSCKRDTRCNNLMKGCLCKEGYYRVGTDCVKCNAIPSENVCAGINEEWYEGKMCNDNSCSPLKKNCANNIVQGCFCKDGYYRQGEDCIRCEPSQPYMSPSSYSMPFQRSPNQNQYAIKKLVKFTCPAPNEEWYQGQLCNPEVCEPRNTNCNHNIRGCICKPGYHRMGQNCVKCAEEDCFLPVNI